MRRQILIFASMISVLVLLSPLSYGGKLDQWYDGIEEDLLGHSFDDEYWSTEISNTTESGDVVKFSISYINAHDVQAFLVALHSVTDPENGTGTLPYQLFGMHFTTTSGEEVFISALFAFLLAYNDTNGNDIPDPATEKLFHVIPFGADKALKATYPPKVTSINVEKISTTHFRFGMRYENLYALVTDNFLATQAFKTGWIAKFTVLKIVYDIQFNEDTGAVTAETFYDIGEVTELWAFILGIPIPVDPNKIPDNFGLAAVHYVNVFTSKYEVKGATSGNSINTDITKPVDENISIEVRTKRAFEIGFRGDYVLKDSLGNIKQDSAPALNILLQARLPDLLLVLWQLGFSANVFSFMAYGVSANVRELYSSPNELKEKSLNPSNKYGFRATALWYVVCFPDWNGYRIEHDPVYTAYTGAKEVENEPGEDKGVCGSSMIVFSMMLAVPAMAIYRNRKHI